MYHLPAMLNILLKTKEKKTKKFANKIAKPTTVTIFKQFWIFVGKIFCLILIFLEIILLANIEYKSIIIIHIDIMGNIKLTLIYVTCSGATIACNARTKLRAILTLSPIVSRNGSVRQFLFIWQYTWIYFWFLYIKISVNKFEQNFVVQVKVYIL